MFTWAGAAISALAAGLCCGGARAEAPDPPPAAAAVRVVRDSFRGTYGIYTESARLRAIGAALERATGCRVDVDDGLAGRRLTVALSPRPPDRLFIVLSRRANARLSVTYRLRRRAPGEAQPLGRLAFASQPVTLDFPQPTPLPDVLRELPVSLKLDEGLDGKVHVVAAGRPLARVLDSLATQLGARWETTVELSRMTAVDAEAAEDQRRRSFFAGLAPLSPAERREEILADVEAVEQLAADLRRPAVQQMARDVLSLAALYENTPAEHREPVGPLITGIVADYRSVLATLPRERRELFQPVSEALASLANRRR